MTLETNPVNVNSSLGLSSSSPDPSESKQDDIVAAFKKIFDATKEQLNSEKEQLSSETNIQIAQRGLPIRTLTRVITRVIPRVIPPVISPKPSQPISPPQSEPIKPNDAAGKRTGNAQSTPLATESPTQNGNAAAQNPTSEAPYDLSAYIGMSPKDQACFWFSKHPPGSRCEQVINDFNYWHQPTANANAGRDTGETARGEPLPGQLGSEPPNAALPASALAACRP